MDQQEVERGGPGTRVGERLAAERIRQGLSLADIAARTRVPRRTLEMLEAGETSGLPALTYTAGFVRSYGDALALDGNELAQRFRAEMGRVPPPPVPPAYEVADPAHVPTRLLAIVALVVAVLIAGAYALWRGDGLFGGGVEEHARLAAGTSDRPATPGVPRAVPAAPAQPAAGGPVVLAATDDVWLKVTERGGATLFMGVLAAGQRFEVPPGAVDPVVRTSRAQALAVTVGGVAVAPLGPPETLVKDASLKRDALVAGRAAPLVGPGSMAAARANP